MSTVCDANGQRVPLLDPGVDWLVGNRERIDQATAERMMDDLNGVARASRRFLLGGIAFVVLLTIAAVVAIAISVAIEGQSAWRDLVDSLAITGPAVMAMLLAGVFAPILVARTRRLARSRDVMLRHGHCPHCGYRIAELPPQPETGHVRCPECGCAWTRPT